MKKFNNDSELLISKFPKDINPLDSISGDVDFKILYIDKLLKSDYSLRTLNQSISLFNKIAKWEDLFKKDFFDFDISETKLIFKDLKRPSLATLSSEKSILDKYLYFAIDNKKSKTSIHPSFNIKGAKALNEFVNTKSRKNKFITYNEYLELREQCINYQDEAFIVLLWNGAYDKDLESIRNIQSPDIDELNKNVKHLNIKLSNEEFNVLVKAKQQRLFIDELTGAERELSSKSSYLFRACGKDKDESVLQILLLKRFSKITSKINNRDLKVRSIVASGIFYRSKDLINNNSTNNVEYFEYMIENKISRNIAKEIKTVLDEKYKEESLSESSTN